ncbi:hypothetical protein OS493_038511 [Desmophyllum pertusum]|uniref:UPAR/Ly6 domain-containing protein n=1 Tax=Desmophyllum pertusum TaxID=174260 RepID=A0A9X0D823_9CNID|nr:hypothetical protein OS493_038511 [Desmophyllum pertusum]
MFTKDCLAGAQWSPCSPEDNPACRDGDACIISCCNSDYCNGDSVGTTVGTTVGAGSAFHISALGSRKCYVCSSTTSWEDCTMTSHTCPAGFDNCATVYFKTYSIENIRKYCLPKSKCNQYDDPNCKNAPLDHLLNVKSSCCDTDNCNAGSAFRISGILLLTCALASLMILVKA